MTRTSSPRLPSARTAAAPSRLRPALRRAAWALALGTTACTAPQAEPELGPNEQARLYSDVSGAGPGNGVEWQIDAPWRMEPDPASEVTYDRLPIVITFHDMDMQGAEDGQTPTHYGRFCGLYVMHGTNVDYIAPSQFHEIEASKRWLNTGYLTPGADSHLVRKMWNGDQPDDVLQLHEWSEWHATALYDLPTPPSGQDVELLVMARVSNDGICTPQDPTLDYNDLLWQQMEGRTAQMPSTDSMTFSEFLKVHYAAEPLPRFDTGWVYGDLHYHSQGTDNEGESAINYRGVIQAMKGMGMDYVFATDHASNSHQITGIDSIFVNDLPFIPSYLDFVEDWIIEFLEDNGIAYPVTETDALRDLSPQRFAHLYHWLNDPNGANAEVDGAGGSSRRPQIFLGAELDVIPEISDEEKLLGRFTYAHDHAYVWSDACTDLPSQIMDFTDFEEGDCVDDLSYPGSDPTRWGVRDVQGLGQIKHARQHVLHLPTPGDGQFIAGDTTEFGGANRWLSTIIDEELDQAQKGYFFLAHPVAAASGSHVHRLGPDIVPYSDTQLRIAFESPYVLGLQFWNEDTRQKTVAPSGSDRPFPFLADQGYPDPELPGHVIGTNFDWDFDTNDETHLWESLTAGAAMWDQMLRWGINPAYTASAEGVDEGQPRKLFMAGGSDGHGDLNYRRTGRFFGWAGANDTAIGKPRNLTHVGDERTGIEGAVGQTDVIDALRAGRFSVTDGPALRIAIDVNGNDIIDSQDVPMGGDFTITDTTAPLLVEWISTPEFGPVRELDVYVGVQAGSHEGLVYAPQGHGPVGGGACVDGAPFTDAAGQEYCPMEDGYVRDPSGGLTLTIPLNSSEGWGGTHRIDLDPADFPVFDYECTVEVIEIWVDDETGGHYEYIEQRNCEASNVQTPSRLYTRAFARTEGQGAFMRRYAFSNPIWMTAQQVASAPTVDVQHLGCADDINDYSVAVAPGAIPGTITKEVKVGAGSWQPLMSNNFSAPGGNSVTVRAMACNAEGCSGYAQDMAAGPTCAPPPPSAPSVAVEFTHCDTGTNHFVTSVQSYDPTTAQINEWYRVGSGNWLPLNSALITASSNQTVYLRANACNSDGACSNYAQTSEPGPYCPVGGNGGGDGGGGGGGWGGAGGAF